MLPHNSYCNTGCVLLSMINSGTITLYTSVTAHSSLPPSKGSSHEQSEWIQLSPHTHPGSETGLPRKHHIWNQRCNPHKVDQTSRVWLPSSPVTLEIGARWPTTSNAVQQAQGSGRNAPPIFDPGETDPQW